MIMDYHLVFIVISVIMLLITIFVIFFEEIPEKVYAALILIGLNMILCLINWLGFFGIDIIGYTGDGGITLNTQPEMYMFFSFFYLLFYINLILVFYLFFRHVMNVWDIKDE